MSDWIYCHGNHWRHQGGASRGTCPAVKTCAPAVPWQLAGRWVERTETPAARLIGTNLHASFTFNLSVTARYSQCDSQSYLLAMVIFDS